MFFAVLGPLEVSGVPGQVSLGGPKERRLLAQLIAHAPEVVSTHALIDGLWSGRPPRTAGRTLQSYVVRLRRALEPAQVLVTQPPGYRLAVGPADVDALRFSDLVVGARRAGERGAPSEADRLADEALRLWRGTPYAEFQDAEFGAAEARRLEGLRLTALETRNDAQLALGRHPELVPSLEALCHEYPYCERFWAQLVVALYRCGRQADALAVYRSARAVLVEEVGVEPGPELRRLEEQVLAQDPRLEEPERLGDGGPLPAALDPSGRRLAGRQSELAWLRTAWRAAAGGQGRVCVLAGPEGSGRTRLAAEVASEAHAAGAAVAYAPRLEAGAAIADAMAAASRRAVLLVLDDLDALPDPSALHLSEVAAAAVTRRLLVVGTYDPALASAALRAELLGAGHDERLLEPLDDHAVARVLRWYAADADAALVERVSAHSGGWPAAVHDVAGRLVGEEAAARVGAAGRRAVRAREALAAVREDVRDGVRDLARARQVRTAQQGGGGRVSCPYKGLSRYDEADANLFFGREALVTALCARLVDTQFVAVVGPSGSGKSSLVRAGLLPALADGVVPGLERLPRVVLAPGADPLAALEAAVSGRPDALIVVDQFEEVFTAGAGAHARAAFFDALLATVDGDRSGRVVMTVRGDYVGACAEHAGLAARLAEGTVFVAPMMADEVRRAVERPARQVGLDVERELADAIVADVTGQPAALPLLSAALVEAWERRQDRTLTMAAYLQTDGISGAVARLADSAYGRLDGAARPAARRLLLRLADTGETGTPVGRRVAHDELPRDPATDRALAVFVNRRLLTAGDTGIELAHEALLTRWPRLVRWLEEDSHGRALRRHLTPAARGWDRAGRPDAELYRGARLAAALDWVGAHGEDLTETERTFIDASRGLADRELREQRSRADREARGRRRLRALLAALAGLLVVAVVASGVALDQRGAARDSERRAEAQRLGARALIEPDLDRALLLAAEAVRTDASLETQGDLLAVLARSPEVIVQVRGDGDRLLSVDASRDGRLLVAGDNSGTVVVWDAATLRRSGEPLQVGVWSPEVAIAPDSRTLAVDDGEGLALWDLERRSRIRSLDRDTTRAGPVAFEPIRLVWSNDGRYLAAAYNDGMLRVYDVATSRVAHAVRVGSRVQVAAAGPYILVAAVSAREVLVVDPAAGRVVRRVKVPLPVGALGASADGSQLGVGSEEGDVVIADLPTGIVRKRWTAHAAPVLAIAFSPDERLLATMSDDRDAAVWSVATGAPQATLHGHSGKVLAGVFSPDSRTLYTGSLDGTVIAWDATGDRAFGRRALAGQAPPLSLGWSLGWSADARRAVVSWQGRILTADTWTGRVRSSERVVGPGEETRATVTADGAVAFLAGTDGRVSRFDVSASRVVTTATPVPGQPLSDIALSPDGRYLVVTAFRFREGDIEPSASPVYVLDARTLRPTGKPMEPGFPAAGVSVSPDGRSVVFGSLVEGDGRVSLWDLRTRRARWTVTSGARNAFATAFSPDGRRVVTVTQDGRAVVLDVASGNHVTAPVTVQAGFVLSVGYRPDGRVIVTSGTDGTVGLWDADRLHRIGRPLVAADNLWVYAAFSSDGRRLVAFDGLGRSTTWSASPADWLQRACSVVHRDFTRAEWDEYEPNRPYRHTCT